MTETEKRLWAAIRNKKLYGVQFYRQKIIGSYIVDFYAPAGNLVIEIDGSQHLKQENREQDILRDAYLNGLGVEVLRFTNSQILNVLPRVITLILNAIEHVKK